MRREIMMVKFRAKDKSGFVFRVLLVKQGRSPKSGLPKPSQVSYVMQVIAEDQRLTSPTYRIFYGSEGAKDRVAELRKRLGEETEVRTFDFSDFYPDGTSAARRFVRAVVSSASSSSRTT